MPTSFRRCYAHFIRPTLKVAANYGLNTSEALAVSGLAPSLAHKPYQIINDIQLVQLFSHLLTMQPPAEFGIEIGREIGLVDKGALGHAQLSARNLRHIMALGQQFMPMLMPLLNWSMNVKQKTVSISYQVSLPINSPIYTPTYTPIYAQTNTLIGASIDTPPSVSSNIAPELTTPPAQTTDTTLEQFLVDIILGMHIHQAQRAFPNLSPNSLQLPNSKKQHFAHYQSIFQGDIEFDGIGYSLCFPMQSFDAKLPNYDPHMCDILETECTKLLRSLEQEHDIVSAVEQQLSARMGIFPGIEQLASKLDMSARTLRRRLQEKGSSYQRLLNSAKHRRAMELLDDGSFELHAIAQLCGFSEVRNFNSSFKRWQGCTVQDYQQKIDR